MILKNFPEFAQSKLWRSHLEFWEDEEPGLFNEMNVFSSFAKELMNNREKYTTNPKFVFLFIEKLIVEGDKEIRDAATTCFLENLINSTSYGTLNLADFIHLLGPESRAYCKAWDEFTGIKTPGLWDE